MNVKLHQQKQLLTSQFNTLTLDSPLELSTPNLPKIQYPLHPTETMHFRAVTTILLATLAASVSAMAIKPALALSGRPDNITLDVQVTAVNLFGFKNADGSLTIDSSLEARDDIEKRGATLVVLGITGTAAMAKVTEMAIEWGAELLGNINE